MNKKNIIIINCIAIIIFSFFLSSCEENTSPNTNQEIIKISPVLTPYTPAPTATSRPFSYPTITIPDQEKETQAASKSAEAFLITLKENNWAKQYDKLLHEDIKSLITKDEYIKYWQENLSNHPIFLGLVGRVDFIKEFKIKELDKSFSNVAVVQPQFLKEDRTSYDNPILYFIYLAKNSEGYWEVIWYKS